MARKKTMESIGAHKPSSESLFGELPIGAKTLNIEEKSLSDTTRLSSKYVSLEKIDDNSKNPFDVKNTFFLAESIKRLGQLQPIILVHQLDENEKPTGRYEIKAGSRRFQALKSILEDAIKNNDEKLINKYSEAWATILPIATTEKEVQEVVTETNTTTRHITIAELFKNFDIVYKTDEDGNFLYMAKREDKVKAGVRILKEMGFDYSPSSIKGYLVIYLAHNQDIRKDLENGFLSLRQAQTVARMQPSMQDSVMKKFKDMTEKEIADYIKTYNSSKKTINKQIKGIDFLDSVSRTYKQISGLTNKEIHVKDENQKAQILTHIEEMMKTLEELKAQLKG